MENNLETTDEGRERIQQYIQYQKKQVFILFLDIF
jgi:hypothetical protein